ncbi:MAG: ABC transporter permease [Desulfomonile tiedjei]|uniref:ABC transporter permease n=1 Tax=Desulfomonile tiedjei TaxID=2358 RepID=A0A9D6V7V0_9BACT|nr:ABC transporter permease [Desulfomonile tiedjei]
MMLSDLAMMASRQIIRTRRRYRAPLIGATLGIASLIIVYTLGDLIQKSLGSNLSLLGSASLIKLTLPLVSLEYPDDPRYFSDEDLKDIQKIPGVILASPTVYSWWPTQIHFDATYRGKEYFGVRVMGVNADFFKLAAHMPIVQGRQLTHYDTENAQNVCVIGNDVKDWLFPENVSPLGESIIISGIAFQVVGVLGHPDDHTLEETVILPISVARNKLTGLYSIRRLTVLPEDIYSVERVHKDITSMLESKKPLYKYSVVLDKERVMIIKNIMHIFALFVYAAVVATLIISEIGIINVMLSMVKERTYEVGLKKAVGASDTDVIAQFIIESVIVGLVSAIVGVFLGSAIVLIVSETAIKQGIDFQKYQLAVMAAVTIGGLAGIVSGIFPARAAARLNPAVAMRME